MPQTKTTSHNACSVNHFNVSYCIQIDRGDFPVDYALGDFSIIDPCFQVETYGSHLVSDFSFIENYSVRRCFVEFVNLLPPHLKRLPISFSILYKDLSFGCEGSSRLHCRCFFGSSRNFDPRVSEHLSIDFELSLTVEYVGANKNNRSNKNNERKNK